MSIVIIVSLYRRHTNTQTPNMGGSVSKGRTIMTSSLTSSMTKSLQKEY